MNDRGAVTLEVAAAVARLDDVSGVRRALALPGGAEELAQMIAAFCERPAEERRRIVERMQKLSVSIKLITSG